MSTLLLAALLAVGADEPEAGAKAAAPPVEGKWLIVYAEEGGRRNNSWEQRQATVHHNTLSYEADGKQHSLHLKFGAHQTLQASSSRGKGHHGVYIAGQDYLCISLESGHAGGAREEGAGNETAAAGDKHGHSSGSFILILRRQRSARTGQ